MARDAKGISWVNLFEEMKSSAGVTYSALRGSETAITYRGSDGSEVTTPNYRMSGDEISRYAAMESAEGTGYPSINYVTGKVR